MSQNDETNQEIGDDDSEDNGESTISCDIEDDDLDHQRKIVHVGKAHRDKSLRSTSVPL